MAGWIEAEIAGTNELRWLPVYRGECVGHGHVLGMTPSGSYVEASGSPVALGDESGPRFLFLLEHQLDQVRSSVRAALATAGVQDVPLPVSAIVAAALRCKMEYWAALAVSWLEQDAEQHPDLQGLVAAAVESPWASQGTRHRLHRFMR